MTARAKLKEPITARPRMAISPRKPKPGEIGEGIVSHPTLEGMQEKVSRIINTVEYMAARKQLDKRQIRVAEMLLNAHRSLRGNGRGCAQMVRSRIPQLGTLTHPGFVAERLFSEAKETLKPSTYRLLLLVVVEGHTIEQANKQITGKTSKHYLKLAGIQLRDGLTALAAKWEP